MILLIRHSGDLHLYERVKSAIEYTLEKNGSTVTHDFKFETSLSVSKFHLINSFILKHRLLCAKVIMHTIDERLEFYAGISEIWKKWSCGYTDVAKSFVVNPETLVRLIWK